MRRADAIALVQKIMDLDYVDDDELDEWLTLLERGLGCPHIVDLIFWRDPATPAEVVDQAIAYQPIALGPAPYNGGHACKELDAS